MKNEQLSNQLNIGTFLSILFSTVQIRNKREEVLRKILIAIIGELEPPYDPDKSAVSKLISHKIELPTRVKRKITETKAQSNKEFPTLISEIIGNGCDQLVQSIHSFINKHVDAKTDELSSIIEAYKNDTISFFYNVFIYAALADNTPSHTKMNRGRKKRGSKERIFFLSQSEKEYEAENLRTIIFKSNDDLSLADLTDLLELMNYTNLSFDESGKYIVTSRFIKKMFLSDLKRSREEFERSIEVARYNADDDNKWKYEGWSNQIYKSYIDLLINSVHQKLNHSLDRQKYGDAFYFLLKIESDVDLMDSEQFRSKLKSNHFYLPKIDGHITPSIWYFAKEMAQLAKKLNIQNHFIAELDNRYELSDKNKTIRDRIQRLKRIIEAPPAKIEIQVH